MQRQTTVIQRLDSSHNQLIQANRIYIRTVAEVLLVCARQGLALHGHDESMDSQNRGNFRATYSARKA